MLEGRSDSCHSNHLDPPTPQPCLPYPLIQIHLKLRHFQHRPQIPSSRILARPPSERPVPVIFPQSCIVDSNLKSEFALGLRRACSRSSQHLGSWSSLLCQESKRETLWPESGSSLSHWPQGYSHWRYWQRELWRNLVGRAILYWLQQNMVMPEPLFLCSWKSPARTLFVGSSSIGECS